MYTVAPARSGRLPGCPAHRPTEAVVGLQPGRAARVVCNVNVTTTAESFLGNVWPPDFSAAFRPARACVTASARPRNPHRIRENGPQLRRVFASRGADGGGNPAWTRDLARLRTDHFDSGRPRRVARSRPAAVLLFSDVGSASTCPSAASSVSRRS